MSKTMRRLSALILIVMLLPGVSVFALPALGAAFWQLDAKYNEALQNSDHQGVIAYARQEVDILAQYPLEGDVLEFIGARTERIALSYETLGDHASSAEWFGRYAGYAAKLGYADAVKIAAAKAAQYTPQLTLYTLTDRPQRHYGAMHEPETGVLYGLPVDAPTAPGVPDASVTLIYQEYGDDGIFPWIAHVLGETKGRTVEYALNVPGQGSQLDGILADTDFLPKLTDTLVKFPDIRIFLRFGAEMNIWDDRPDPGKYIAAFRKVADAVRAATGNVAMVWSPNMVSSWDVRMDDFYPGDDYADWVGASLYMNRYFLGKVWSAAEQFNEVVFFAGDSALPVLALGELAESYGGRKPIMLSESGASHTVRTLGRDETLWAANRLQQLYTYLPMVYPQVKLIAHFDKVMPNEHSDYSLSDSPTLAALYKTLVSSPVFIQGEDKSSGAAYRRITDTVTAGDSLTLYVYAHRYGEDTPRLDFYIDGAWRASGTEVGYKTFLDLSDLAAGDHTLRVTGVGLDCEYTLRIEEYVKLYIDGKAIVPDVPPRIVNGRTLVPVRVISENMGATVGWNGSSGEVTVDKDGVRIVMTIDSDTVTVGGEAVKIDVPPTVVDGRTLVPVRFVSEVLKLKVDWNEAEKAVYISSK